jgi:mono/diheme cytochrome c family protein
MKKTILILAMAVFVFSCARKNTPAATAPSVSTGNPGKVIGGGNAPAAAPAGSAATTATATPSVPSEATGSRTPATPSTTAAPEVQGQSTYNAKCGKCHGLKVVSDYTADRWASIMAVMGPKARLSETETANVMAYVKTNAKK